MLILKISILTGVYMVAGKGFGDALKSSFSEDKSNEGFHMSAAQIMFIERMESLRQKYATMINTEFDLSTYELHEHMQYGMLEHDQRQKRSPTQSRRVPKRKSIRYRSFRKHHSNKSD